MIARVLNEIMDIYAANKIIQFTINRYQYKNQIINVILKYITI